LLVRRAKAVTRRSDNGTVDVLSGAGGARTTTSAGSIRVSPTSAARTLVLAHAVERAWRDGAAVFDFLRARERYKYFWGAVHRSTFSLEARLG